MKYQITLYSDAKASQDRFAIVDKNKNVIWYGKFFDTDRDYTGEQWTGELCSAKKAIWLAGKIKEELKLEHLQLNLYVDAQWLTYQDHPKQKSYILTWLANKYGIVLNVVWISGKENPADYWTTESGYKNWRETFDELKNTIEPIIDTNEDAGLSDNNLIKKIRGINTDDFTRLQKSEFNFDYFNKLKKSIFGYDVPFNYYNDVEIDLQEKLHNYKFKFVFGKWLSETEKLFWLYSIDFLIEKNNILKNQLKKNKKDTIISIGASGKGNATGFFAAKKENYIVQYNNFQRKDKVKSKERFILSGIGSIYHELVHLIDYNNKVSNKIDNKKILSFREKNKDLRKKLKLSHQKFNYYLSKVEITARCGEIILKEKFLSQNDKIFKDNEIIDYEGIQFLMNDKVLAGSTWDLNIDDDFKKFMYLETYKEFGIEIEKTLLK